MPPAGVRHINIRGGRFETAQQRDQASGPHVRGDDKVGRDGNRDTRDCHRDEKPAAVGVDRAVDAHRANGPGAVLKRPYVLLRRMLVSEAHVPCQVFGELRDAVTLEVCRRRAADLPRFSDLAPDKLLASDPADAHSRIEGSEEHTSELQSPCNLVCRLLPAKKKQSKPMLSASHRRLTTAQRGLDPWTI